MKKIGLAVALRQCTQYQKMGEDQRTALQNTRLQELVTYARKNSPIYAELYRELPEGATLQELPPVNKAYLMEHFDEWVTDSEVKLRDLQDFMTNLDNIGRKFKNEYLVFTTSGSTGNPLVALCDKTTNNVMGAINVARSFAHPKDRKTFILRGGKTIGVFATGGFYLGNSSVRARQLQMPWKKHQMCTTSALLPIRQIVDELNRFKPVMLGGYPSNLELLVEEKISGRLHIEPIIIMTGGEYLSSALRKKLSDAFHCTVQTSYSCTEGGTIACECAHQHFHINDDWVIVEPVDKDNKPVPDGVQSDKILLTNLYNYTQPFIRYEVTDRVVMHHERCSCGNPSPWLTLEGRTDDVLHFTVDGNDTKVPPLAVYATLKEVHALKRFQVVVHPGNRIELRIEPDTNTDKQKAFAKAKETLVTFLATHDVNGVIIELSDEAPKQHPKSGKFKHIICEER